MSRLRRRLAYLVLSFAATAAPSQAQQEKPWLEPFGWAGRGGALREKLLRSGGGTGASEAAVARGLEWLARQQKADGRWKFDGDLPDKGQGSDIAATSLVLLSFLGANKTHREGKDNPYDRVVDKGLKFLVASQNRKTGSFDADLKAHSLATTAICEAFVLPQDYAFKKPARFGLNRLVDSQHPDGGWGKESRQPGDTSTTGWAILALKFGKVAQMDVPDASLAKSLEFLDSMNQTTTEGYGLTNAEATPETSAIGLLCRQNLQTWGPQNLRLIKGIDNWIKPNYPKQGRNECEFRFFATQVMHHFGGIDWKAWNVKMRELLVQTQDRGTDTATNGSWSPQGDPLAKTGGRLAVTALNVLTLETYYRQIPMGWKQAE